MKVPLEVIVGRSLMATLILILLAYNSSVTQRYLSRSVRMNCEGYESFAKENNSLFFGIVMEKLMAENKGISFVLPGREVKRNKIWYYRNWLITRFTKLPIRYEKYNWSIEKSQFRRLKDMSVYKGMPSGWSKRFKFWVAKEEDTLKKSQNVLRFFAYKDNVVLVPEGLGSN